MGYEACRGGAGRTSRIQLAIAASAFGACAPVGADGNDDSRPERARVDGVYGLSDEVARIVIEAMEAERFLILVPPAVHEDCSAKPLTRSDATVMRRLRDKILFSQPQLTAAMPLSWRKCSSIPASLFAAVKAY